MTNTEFNVLMKESKSIGPDGLSFNENFNTTPEGFAPSIDPGEESNDTVLAPVPGSTIRKPRTCFGVCYAVTGMDQNVKDFWLTSDINAPLWRRILYPPSGSKALLNGIEVDYFKLYKLPNKDVEQGNDMV
ncbi:hypothetical protein FOB22_000084 [Saccharomyces cerevisiae]|nr:hypothetical protein FOB22_000084 [Saccharomyces cerevisiae]